VSCAVIGSSASRSIHTMFDLSIACSDRITENCSIPGTTLPRLLIPAVSMRLIDISLYSNNVSTASRVVPGIGETIERVSLVIELTKVDYLH